MDHLKNESFDFLRGYHRAMVDVATRCLEETKVAKATHEATPSKGFFGKPSAVHYIAIGRGRAASAISQFCTEAGDAAFNARPPTPTFASKRI